MDFNDFTKTNQPAIWVRFESLPFDARLSYHSSAFCIRWLPFTSLKERITKLSEEEVLQRPVESLHWPNNNPMSFMSYHVRTMFHPRFTHPILMHSGVLLQFFLLYNSLAACDSTYFKHLESTVVVTLALTYILVAITCHNRRTFDSLDMQICSIYWGFHLKLSVVGAIPASSILLCQKAVWRRGQPCSAPDES